MNQLLVIISNKSSVCDIQFVIYLDKLFLYDILITLLCLINNCLLYLIDLLSVCLRFGLLCNNEISIEIFGLL